MKIMRIKTKTTRIITSKNANNEDTRATHHHTKQTSTTSISTTGQTEAMLIIYNSTSLTLHIREHLALSPPFPPIPFFFFFVFMNLSCFILSFFCVRQHFGSIFPKHIFLSSFYFIEEEKNLVFLQVVKHVYTQRTQRKNKLSLLLFLFL